MAQVTLHNKISDNSNTDRLYKNLELSVFDYLPDGFSIATPLDSEEPDQTMTLVFSGAEGLWLLDILGGAPRGRLPGEEVVVRHHTRPHVPGEWSGRL